MSEERGPLMRMIWAIIEWGWGFLPDQCEMPGCCREGVRGNENVIDGKIVCDYCHFKMRFRDLVEAPEK